MSSGRSSREKGMRAERQIVELFRQVGQYLPVLNPMSRSGSAVKDCASKVKCERKNSDCSIAG